jgi:hypothetical protein
VRLPNNDDEIVARACYLPVHPRSTAWGLVLQRPGQGIAHVDVAGFILTPKPWKKFLSHAPMH